LKQHLSQREMNYPALNDLALEAPIGSEGLLMLPFGNGAERMLGNLNVGATVKNINFNIHSGPHLARAAQEGVAFSMHYGMEMMKEIGINPKVIRAGLANMFLSPVFRETLAEISGATIELYDTYGSLGAANGAGIGSGTYGSFSEAFENLNKRVVIEPSGNNSGQYQEAFHKWTKVLELCLANN
jgi:xylulokinase